MSRPDVEIAKPDGSHLDSMIELWNVAFNPPAEFRPGWKDRVRLPRFIIGLHSDRVVATAQAHPLQQWFGGLPMKTAGVASVAIDPLHRGTGLGAEIMRRLLEEARAAGNVFATLYPSTVPFYRRLGFEYGGVQTTYSVPLAALPSNRPRPGAVVEMPEDPDLLKASLRRLAQRENGVTEGLEEDWWHFRVFDRVHIDAAAVMTPEEIPDGYATYRQEEMPEAWGYRVICTHLVANTRRAALALLGYFRGFKGVGQELQWAGPPTEPMALLLGEPSLKIVDSFRFMSRILDVPGALEARGYPEVDGEATLAVQDPLIEENSGVFRLDAEAGKVRVSRLGEMRPAGRAIGIGALSSMFSGYLTPWAAARIGLVEAGDPALPLLEMLFAGPAPWTPDHF